ncbi:MAG: bifunctional 4-hydroxy-2-oxoglutarate aldolase/2-dehydro-3-deoxy-phosphogluconate aldolase [Luminiphilus sp.]
MDARPLLAKLTCPLVPVVVIDRLADAVPLAESLLQGGISALEITLRTPAGYDAIKAMKSAFPDAVIGAGTVCSDQAFDKAVGCGADFIVSPGATDQLFAAAARHKVPFLPGAVTGSEVLKAIQHDYATLKFFPAEAAGGVSTLRALSGPFPELSFMPTGGITPDNVATYLRLESVCAVGGSWLTPRELLVHKRWDELCQLAGDSVARVAEVSEEKST